MSPDEIAWRVRSTLRDASDRVRIRAGRWPSVEKAHAGPGSFGAFRVSDVAVGEWATSGVPAETAWADALRRRGDALCAHKLSFFDLREIHLGDPIDWNRDHSAGKPAPLRFAQSIDYRDFRETGDCKLVWEPNRHHHIVVLARAYRATGDVRYAEEVAGQLTSWLDQCPPGIGMNWRSPLEEAIRLINWVWILDLVRESGAIGDALATRLSHAAYLHAWDVSRKYSRGSSANNHIIGEAAGVFIGASYFSGLEDSTSMRREARAILIREAASQTHPDGVNREQAFGYHYFVSQFLVLAGLVGRWNGEDFPASYWDTCAAMMEFAGAWAEAGPPPMYGDADDGYVLDLGGDRGDFRPLAALVATIPGHSGLRRWAGEPGEAARWLLGRSCFAELAGLPQPAGARLTSRGFPDAGLYLLQAGEKGSKEALSVGFDCGELGFGAIAAHGHADALSFTLRAAGQDVLVDPGTYDYFTHPEWRAYFRSTAAHNTVRLDGTDQSTPLGLFLWGSRAIARCLAFEPSVSGGAVVGEHFGYTRLDDPATHRRRIEVEAHAGRVLVTDEIDSRGPHNVEISFHAAEQIEVEELSRGRFLLRGSGVAFSLDLDPALEGRALRGRDGASPGWVSRGYHLKARSTTVIARGRSEGPARFACVLTRL